MIFGHLQWEIRTILNIPQAQKSQSAVDFVMFSIGLITKALFNLLTWINVSVFRIWCIISTCNSNG